MSYRESWVEIDGFPNYLVSPEGLVQNSRTGRILRASKNSCGYLKVLLYVDGVGFTVPVHRLVTSAFLGEIPENLEVNHIDGDKENNCVDNLEVITHTENMRHAHRIGIKQHSGGRKKNPIRIVETGEEFDSITEAADKINCSIQQISMYLRGQGKSVYGYTFELIN